MDKPKRSNEEELDLFAELIDPFSEILQDKAVKEAGNVLKSVKIAVKNHKQAVLQIFALLDGVPVEEYHITALAIPAKLVALLNDPALQDLF